MIATTKPSKHVTPAVATKPIVVPTSLLAAVAKWASTDDARPHLRMVLFRAGEMVATDGRRLVRVPVETHGHAFGVDRAHLLAAVAAQRALEFEDALAADPHDGEDNPAHNDDPSPTIVLQAAGGIAQLRITAAEIVLAVPACDANTYPPIEGVMPKQPAPDATSPDGYVLDPRYLAAIEEVCTAMMPGRHPGIRVLSWGRAEPNGDRLGGMLFSNGQGARFVVMPMREP